MFQNINTISGISSKLGQFARSARSKTVLAAAVAATGLGLSTNSFAAVYPTISSVTTGSSSTASSATDGISAFGEGSSYTYSPTSPATNYNVSYAGSEAPLTSITAGGTTYNVSPTQGTTVVQTYSSLPTVTSLWYDGSGGSGTNPSVPLEGPAYTSYASALGSNNFLLGADNVFSTKPDTNDSTNDQGNVARIDVLFTGGIAASASQAFAVFDRGDSGEHDAFTIAAITAESGGVPTAYGTPVTFTEGSWGNTDLVSSSTLEDVLRSNTSGGALHPATAVVQSVGGVLIPTSDLAGAGSTIYGYSLFSAAVTNGDNLVAYNSLPEADDEATGGIDPTATLGNLYTVQVPEPTSAALMAVGIGGLLARRPKRKLA